MFAHESQRPIKKQRTTEQLCRVAAPHFIPQHTFVQIYSADAFGETEPAVHTHTQFPDDTFSRGILPPLHFWRLTTDFIKAFLSSSFMHSCFLFPLLSFPAAASLSQLSLFQPPVPRLKSVTLLLSCLCRCLRGKSFAITLSRRRQECYRQSCSARSIFGI